MSEVQVKPKRKQSFYFTAEALSEIQAEAKRLNRSLSFVIQRAWKLARGSIRELPSDDLSPDG
jgi:uncharacterized small protein (TIGR04563 family)